MRTGKLSSALFFLLGIAAAAQATDTPQAIDIPEVTDTPPVIDIPQVTDASQVSIQFGLQDFRWREFRDTGERLLQETGVRFSIGAAYDNFRREGDGVLYSVNGAIYLGRVNYDGQTQLGEPATTDVDYYGLNIEALGGYRFGRRIGLDVFGGLGLDHWLRSLNDGRTASGTVASGYDEFYTILYGKAGLGFFQQLDGWRYMLQGGVKLPLITSQYVDLGSGVTLHPGIEPSAFANLQFDFGSGRHDRFGFALYYDSYRFSESDPELLTDGSSTWVVVQPRSNMDVYGLRLSYYFL